MSNNYTMSLFGRHGSAFVRGSLPILSVIVLALIGAGYGGVVTGQALSSRNALNRLAQQGGSDAASAMFRGGRDLITDQQWARAEEKFRQYVAGYPNEKNVDAALYWLAYSEFQLTHFDQCKSTVLRLLNNYQKSSWRDDARTLLAQIPSGTGVGSGSSGGTGVGVGVGDGSDLQFELEKAKAARVSAGALVDTYVDLKNVELFSLQDANVGLFKRLGKDEGQPADDDPCEFKIVVLQALFQSDVQRGISAATEWLAPASTQTVRCKGAALTLLARNGGKAVTPVILGIARNEPNVKLRARAIAALGATSDETVIDTLRDFALNSQDNDIAEAALYALGQHTGTRAVTVLGEIATSSRAPVLRKVAIGSIASRPGEPAVDALLKIYDADQSVEIRKYVIAGLGHRKSERAGNKLLEIARGADNIELRKAAISGIASRSGEKAIDILLGLYDTEKSEELKDRIINSIGSSSDPRVTKKLIEIARNPQSPMDRRRRAIGWLSRSKDPEVTKFLEDLLR
jgi:HEAT repeat protein